jgi:hypothetical protein
MFSIVFKVYVVHNVLTMHVNLQLHVLETILKMGADNTCETFLICQKAVR